MAALHHGLFAVLLETYGHREEVDSAIAVAAAARAEWIHPSLLGELLNCAASTRDWRRADVVWHRLVEEAGVEPTIIQYSGRSKVHMLCGRVLEADRILEEAGDETVIGNFKTVVDHAQLLLLVCHSSPSPENLHRLRDVIGRGNRTIEQANIKHAASEWSKVKGAARRLEGDITSVRLKDVLVEWKARTQSVMKQWDNHAGGSQYLRSACGL
eukprot:UN1276